MKSLNSFRIALLLLLLASAAVAQKRGITPEDYFAFETLSDPHLSPDGKLVAYVVTTIDQKQNRRTSSIWLAATDAGRAPWQFTTSPQSATSPRWSPDGQWLAFVSTRAAGAEPARPQVYVLSYRCRAARRAA